MPRDLYECGSKLTSQLLYGWLLFRKAPPQKIWHCSDGQTEANCSHFKSNNDTCHVLVTALDQLKPN